MWSDRDVEEQQYLPDHLVNHHITIKPRTENGVHGGGGHSMDQLETGHLMEHHHDIVDHMGHHLSEQVIMLCD